MINNSQNYKKNKFLREQKEQIEKDKKLQEEKQELANKRKTYSKLIK